MSRGPFYRRWSWPTRVPLVDRETEYTRTAATPPGKWTFVQWRYRLLFLPLTWWRR